MKNLPTLNFFFLLSFFGMGGLAFGQEGDDFKVAGVDIQLVFQEFYKTTQTETGVKGERLRIQKADREIRSNLTKLDQNLREEEAKGKAGGLSDDEKKAHAQKIKRLVSERNKMNEERESRYRANNTQLDQNMMITMQGILGEIKRFVESHSEKNGYDVVFDTSGKSTNQTATVIGGKGIVDITATVITELNQGSSSPE